MKKIFRNIILFTFCTSLSAQIDRSIPEPGDAPQINFEEPISFELKNGLKVMIVENHKLPRVSINLFIDNPPIYEGELNGVSSITGMLIGKGNKKQKKDDFNEEVDFMGATMSFYSQGGYAATLSRYYKRILTMFSQSALNPSFLEGEFNQQKNILFDNIKNNEKNTPSIARRVEDVIAYGVSHPYGEFISNESLGNVKLENVINFYDEYFKPNNAYLVIIGDVKINETKKLVKELFGKWENDSKLESKFAIDSSNNIISPKIPNNLNIHVIDMPNSTNSEITFQNLVNLKMSDKEYFSVLVANRILGAGAESRLFNNIREDKGYAYGAYSSIGDDKYSKAKFRATTTTRSQVTDSALVEILNEVTKIQTYPVSEKELKNAKAKYLGEFVLAMERTSTIASYAVNIESNKLESDYYKTFLSNINAVTAKDVQNSAIKYFSLENAQLVVTGKGSEIIKNIEKVRFNGKIIPTYFYDQYGSPIDRPVFNKEISAEVNVKSIFENYLNAIGGLDKINEIKSISTIASVKIPNAPFSPTAEFKQKHPNLNSLVMTVEGMGTLMSQKFDGENGYVEQMGQKISFEKEQINLEKEKLGLFEETYLDPNIMKIISLSPIDGKDLYKIKINDKSFRYYDAETNLLILTEETVNIAGNEITSSTKYSNYKEVDGVSIPHKREITSGPQTVVFEISSIKFNEEIEDSFFK